MATSGIRGKSREVQRIHESGGKVVPTATVEEIGLACECVEAVCQNATLSDQNEDMETELAEAHTVKGTMREQLVDAECQITAFKTQLNEAWSTLRSLVVE